MSKQIFLITVFIALTVSTAVVAVSNVFAQDEATIRRTLLRQFNSSNMLVTEFKELGQLAEATIELQKAISYAEEVFGETNIIVIRHIDTLVELLAEQKRFQEAEESFEKIYRIRRPEDDLEDAFDVGFSIGMARLYIKWSEPEKAEVLLTEAQQTIKFSDIDFTTQIPLIEVALEEVEALKIANM